MNSLLVSKRQENLSLGLTTANTDEKIIYLWLMGKAPSTIKTYKTALNQFLRFCPLGIGEVRYEHLMAWLQSLRDKGMAFKTIHSKAACIKALLSFCHKLGYIPANPGLLVKTKEVGAVLTLNEKILDRSGVDALLDVAIASSQRDWLLLKTCFFLGLRVSELVNLKLTDFKVTQDRVVVKVLGKGSKLRELIVPASLWLDIKSYATSNNLTSYLFLSYRGFRLNPVDVHRIIKNYAKQAGLGERVSTHWLRHTHATLALQGGCDVKTLSESLGHSNIATTSGYLHALREKSSSSYL